MSLLSARSILLDSIFNNTNKLFTNRIQELDENKAASNGSWHGNVVGGRGSPTTWQIHQVHLCPDVTLLLMHKFTNYKKVAEVV